ncbi:MAG TPA: hypothetical protein VHH73_12300 [Verrucomicrobiae bacterium]|nr:hypothetical protein [Verrucomicrobiae bacterium]
MKPILILHGAKTGGSARWAKDAVKVLSNAGLDARVVGLLDYAPEELSTEHTVLICLNSPVDGEKFWDRVSQQPLDLLRLRYSICALGRARRKSFFSTSPGFHTAFERHGARCFNRRVECHDRSPVSWLAWIDTVLTRLK